MSVEDKALLQALARHQWLSCLVSIVMSVLLSSGISAAWYLATCYEYMSLIEAAKCRCESRGQINDQRVTVAPGWSREDTIREELKRRAEQRE